MTASVDIAAWLVSRHGAEKRLTNMSLNRLCFFAQVESLRSTGTTVFDDSIVAWRCGPVCPAVYHAYERYGRASVPAPVMEAPDLSDGEAVVMDMLWKDYGWLSAYDLVRLSCRDGGAWSKAWTQGQGTPIMPGLILDSVDVDGFDPDRTFAASVKRVERRYRNTLRLLADS